MDSGLRCPERLGMHLGSTRSTCSSRLLALVLHLRAAPIPDVLRKVIISPLQRDLGTQVLLLAINTANSCHRESTVDFSYRMIDRKEFELTCNNVVQKRTMFYCSALFRFPVILVVQ
jgi:hypothetical protein